MAKHIKLETTKDYATEANAIKAISRFPYIDNNPNLRYLILQNEAGRYFPAFIGQEALTAQVHFHFHVIM